MENLDNTVLTHLKRRDMLVDMYAQRMFVEYDIKEVTTPKQKANGTRMFQLPNGVQIASYKTGYVRKVSRNRVYQLNKKYLQNQRFTTLTDSGYSDLVRSLLGIGNQQFFFVFLIHFNLFAFIWPVLASVKIFFSRRGLRKSPKPRRS